MKQKNKNKRLTHKLRHGQVQQVMSTKGGDVHRGMGQRSETRVSKGKTKKKIKTYTCCAGAWTDAGGLGATQQRECESGK